MNGIWLEVIETFQAFAAYIGFRAFIVTKYRKIISKEFLGWTKLRKVSASKMVWMFWVWPLKRFFNDLEDA